MNKNVNNVIKTVKPDLPCFFSKKAIIQRERLSAKKKEKNIRRALARGKHSVNNKRLFTTSTVYNNSLKNKIINIFFYIYF